MILVDANLLLHAYNPRSVDHQRGKTWVEEVLSGSDPVGFAWPTLWAFLRISTNARVFTRPLSPVEADEIVSTWLERPVAVVLQPGDRHWHILRGLMRDGQVSGPLVTDAVLAAIAIEHGATLCTTDRDFARFPGLQWMNPLD